MTINNYVNRNECIVTPFTSLASIEEQLVEGKYLVIKDKNTFIGLLTVLDVVKNYHYHAIDCFTKKPIIYGTEKVDDVLAKMIAFNQTILPVFNEREEYIGSVEYETVLRNRSTIMRNEVQIDIVNLVGNKDVEQVKQNFLSEMLHNTKNPIQVIYSSVSFMKENPSKEEQEILLNSILTSTKQIDVLITRLFENHFNQN